MSSVPSPSALSWFSDRLLTWYERHRRDLPWRQSRDPYAIWVSEIMLQQTQVKTVIDYYGRWMRRFPNVRALAEAAEADVLHAWQGLGYYSRARNLRQAAQQVLEQHGGVIPSAVAELRDLPGVGPYSAGAIASIAYDVRAPIVDGNVIRVLTRFFGLGGDPTRAPLKKMLWEIAAAAIPENRASAFNQALMEIGALVCVPRNPLCQACPLHKECVALRSNRVQQLPETAKRVAVTEEHHVAAVVLHRNKVLLWQVPSDAKRWAKMWQFPNTALGPRESVERALLRATHEQAELELKTPELLISLKHSVTRFRITLDAYLYKQAARPRPQAREPADRATTAWVPLAELADYALPAAHARIATALRKRS